MLRLLSLLLLALASPGVLSALELQSDAPATAEFDHSHAAWTRVLDAVLRENEVDYAALAKDHKALDGYLHSLEAIEAEEFKSWTREQRYAFWINAYNAYTIRLVVDHYPLESIRDIGDEHLGTWDRRFIPLKRLFPKAKGELLSLNDIEHEILRRQFADARVHAAVNCASRGCPPLARVAFDAKRLGRQLDDAARAWLADDEQARFDPLEHLAEVSQIFTWFAGDFERDAKSVTGWLAKYAPTEHRGWLAKSEVTLRYRDYDWALNDTPDPEAGE